MKLRIILMVVFFALLFTGCADVAQVQFVNPDEHVYGFWGGTWHGMISGISFIGSLFDDSIAVYAVSNNGAWYDFGFVGGLFTLLKLIRALLNLGSR